MELMESKKEIIQSSEFIQKIREIGQAIIEKRKEIQEQVTPKDRIYKMGDSKRVKWEDLEFIKEDYMVQQLNKHFLGLWSWVAVGSGLQVHEQVGQVSFTGTLKILENGFLREFSACGGSPIKCKRGEAPGYDSVVNFNNDVKAANTNAFKKAINMLTDIGYDVYRKEKEIKISPHVASKLYKAFNDLPSDKEKEKIANYVQGEFGDWEHIPDNVATTMTNNILKLTEILNSHKENQQ